MVEFVKKENVLIALVSAGQCNTRYRLGEIWELNQEEIEKAIDYMYPEDVQPIVYCKDCKHRPHIDGEYHDGFDIEFPDFKCPLHCDDGWYNRMPEDYWYCSFGEY